MRDQTLQKFSNKFSSDWALKPFGEMLLGSVRNGIYKKKEFHGEGIPVVNMGELFAFDFISDQEMKLVQLTDVEIEKYSLADGDLLFARRSLVFEGAGKCSLVVNPPKTTTYESSIIRARPDPQVANSRFLFYLFKSSLGQAAIASIATRTAVSGVRGSNLVKLTLPFPSLVVQRRIAGILSAYDELIENSQRRIRILEDMARALYREWFVHFRFPGHEAVPLVPSPLGEIPQGWEVKTVADAFEISGGGTPSRKESRYWDDGTIQWFAPSNLTGAGTMFMDESGEHITELGLAKSSARLFPAYSVMLTSRATIGAIAINTQEACTNQGFITCIPNERVPLNFLYQWVSENVPVFQRMASGATFKEISRGVFKTIDFIQPSHAHVHRFEELTRPIARQILALQRQTQTLRRTRDLLLPRLLSGQIDLENAA